jgi:3-methylcrotonyl-CoA carboxylase alpha subunit
MPGAGAGHYRRFGSLLIANRGEIACRIIRTARAIGLRTIAVYSDADRHSRHVAMADEAIAIGPAAARDSYLAIDKILEAAAASRAEAIHPGYGFLSESAEFARRIAEAGLIFVGPSAAMIEAMGSKSRAKALMEAAGVPLVPGYHGAAQDEATLARAAESIGYPVLIKASAGGGGRGMRIVRSPDALAEAVISAKREALSAFGDDHVLIEKYIVNPRHIEVQVIGDAHGQLVSLFERECTLQRRHQKVIEEAPSPTLNTSQREAICAAGRKAAAAVGYVGAGTVEFVSDGRDFFFIEMNTRLQVEHPVTEAITGIDLVEWQLRVAFGEPLPMRQDDIRLNGHAVEARVYAEDPARGFMPAVGRITGWNPPAPEDRTLRIDTGFGAGDTVTPYYDAMLAKVITWGQDRSAALSRAALALDQFDVDGVTTNLPFLGALLRHPAVMANTIDTGLIERELDVLAAPAPKAELLELAAAVSGILSAEAASPVLHDPRSPWSASGWLVYGNRRRRFSFHDGGKRHYEVTLIYGRHGATLVLDGVRTALVYESGAAGTIALNLGGHTTRVRAHVAGNRVALRTSNGRFHLEWSDPFGGEHAGDPGTGRIVAPLPGTVVAVLAEAGDTLKKGGAILTLEAMKMEHTLRAPADGVVRKLRCRVGDFVQEGSELAEFEAAEE